MNRYTLITSPRLWLVIPALTIGICLGLLISIRPVWGIDFVGGSLIEIEAQPDLAPQTQAILEHDFSLSASAQPTQDGTIIIRTKTISNETHADIIKRLQEAKIMTGQEVRFETIGPTIGQELRRKTAMAVVIVVLVMVAYLAYTFRQMKGFISPWKFGVAANYALLHDLVLVTGLFVIFGRVWGAPIDTLFVTAQLAILGYSVSDTIVLFDRLARERRANRKDSLLAVMNRSAGLTLGRSLNTSFTILLTLVAILIFGGSTIRWFIVALIAGTITGAYSSIFVAPPLLWWLTQSHART